MTISYVEYDLQDGFINNWLTAGPQATPVQDLPSKGEGFRTQISQKFASAKSGITKMPVERGPLTEGVFRIDKYEGSWEYLRCADDHRVDHSISLPVCHHLRSWAYTQLNAPAERQAAFTLHTAGPAVVWINDQEVFRQDQFSGQPRRYSFQAGLNGGKNEILVRFETVADPAGLLLVALQVEESAGLGVRIPTLIPSLERRSELERVYQTLYLDRDVYAAEDTIYLCWPEAGEKSAFNDARLQNSENHIYAQAEDVGKPNETLFLGYPISLTAGNYHAFVMPRAWEYYESQIRITHNIPAYVMGKNSFSEGPYGSQGERSAEALVYAAGMENHLYAEIAKMALNWWENVEPKVILKAVEQVNQRQAGSQLTVLGLLGMLLRYGPHEKFPQWVKKPVKEALLHFRYSQDEPGSDVLDFTSEASQIVFHTCEILAGQLYPNPTFANSGMTGRQLRQKGEQAAQVWMQACGVRGITAWDSNEAYADCLTALAALIDLAKAEPVWGLASVLMDKLLFAIAINSYKGVFGSTQGSARSMPVKSGLLEATSGITRVLWGLGVFNTQKITGSVSLAVLSNYEMPALIADIAVGLPAECWNREQCGADGLTVNKVTYRTPNGMLASAQDYKAGKPGEREHIWQATLGPNCTVFSSHPACSSEKEELAPNFWRGNGSLPRVAQWKDSLIALYQLPADDLMGYTHAYFPASSFDEIAERDGWMFGRKGDGFVALKCSLPVEFVQQGRTAKRELRARGSQAAWLCQLGSTSQDGDFTTFQEKVTAAPLVVKGLKVKWQTLRGEKLAFDWKGPFLRDGADQPLSGFKHFENLYTTVDFPCEQMEIKTDEYVLRLDFSS